MASVSPIASATNTVNTILRLEEGSQRPTASASLASLPSSRPTARNAMPIAIVARGLQPGSALVAPMELQGHLVPSTQPSLRNRIG